MDDFAHHPTAVRETLLACCQRFKGRRVLAVYHFESNTSRRSVFEGEYGEAFRGAEEVYLTHPLVKSDSLSADQYLDPERVLEKVRTYASFGGAWKEFSALAEALAAPSATWRRHPGHVGPGT